jgi:hypothetical protein
VTTKKYATTHDVSLPWTNLHRLEALRRYLRVLDALVVNVDLERAAQALGGCRFTINVKDFATEKDFRAALILEMRCDSDEADKHVRDVRDLAEGRKVRETFFRLIVGDKTKRIRAEGTRELVQVFRGHETGPCTMSRVARTRRVR